MSDDSELVEDMAQLFTIPDVWLSTLLERVAKGMEQEGGLPFSAAIIREAANRLGERNAD